MNTNKPSTEHKGNKQYVLLYFLLMTIPMLVVIAKGM